MSWIPCTAPCVYQQDGQCTLVRAASQGMSNGYGCLNFVPTSQQRRQSLPDVSHTDKL